MRLFVLRHAVAEDPAPGRPDSERKLTDGGREKLERVLRRAKQAGLEPDAVISSPYVRARQTAEIALRELDVAQPLLTSNHLTPTGNLFEAWNELRGLGANSILVVGHNPQLSELVSWMIGAAGFGVDMKKAGLAYLEVHRAGPQPQASLVWILTPKSAGP